MTREDIDLYLNCTDYTTLPEHIQKEIFGDLEACVEADATELQRVLAASSERQTRRQESNRLNAWRSTGPRTTAGKAASSKNRLAHGLCSRELLLTGESPEEFESLRQQMVSTYQPFTPEQQVLTDQVTQALWRLNRAQRVEAESYRQLQAAALAEFEEEEEEDNEELGLGALGYLLNGDQEGRTMERIARYVTAHERTYLRAVKLLQQTQLRQPRPEPKPEPVKETSVAKTTEARQESPLPPVGFESKNEILEALVELAYVPRC